MCKGNDDSLKFVSQSIFKADRNVRLMKAKIKLLVSFPSLSWSRVGAVVRALASHQCGPGSIPGLVVISGLSLLLVLVLAPRGFSPGIPVFPSPQKPTFPNSNYKGHRFVSRNRL